MAFFVLVLGVGLTIGFVQGVSEREALEQELEALTKEVKDAGYDPEQYENFQPEKVFIPEYSCDETSYHTVRVLTEGVHIQKFVFDGEEAYARNTAYHYFIDDNATWTGTFANTTDLGANISLMNGTLATLSGLPQSGNVQGYWHLDETSGTRVDSSGNSNDLTDQNTVLYGTGKFNNSADFELDNSEYLSITDASQTGLDITGEITISFWVKPESTPNLEHVMVSQCNQTPSPRNESFRLKIDPDDKIEFMLSNDSTNEVNAYSSTALSNGVWYHVAATLNQVTDEMQIYIDGSADGNAVSYTNNIYDSAAPLTIGAQGNPSNYFDGLIDEVIIWDTALSATEIQELYYNSLSSHYNNQTGTYLSKVFDANSTASWNNISWLEMVPYQEELPINQQVENVSGGANMTGNVLLMHLNENITEISNTEPGLVGLWHLNNNNLSDDALDNDGAAGGGLDCSGDAGKFRQGCEFDGSDDYINVSDSASLNITGNFAIGAWVKIPTNVGFDKAIIGKGAGGGGESFAIDIDSSYKYRFFVRNETGGAFIVYTTFNYTTYTDWVHLTSVFNGTNLLMYANGALDNTASFTGTSIQVSTTWVGIGARPNSDLTPFYYFNGTIDEVAIYNRSLTAAEILAHYKAGNATIRDDSGQGNNGNATNGVVKGDGKFNTALEFDGDDDYVDLGDVNDLANTDYTLEAWVKFPTLAEGDNYWVLGKDESGQRAYAFGISKAIGDNEKINFQPAGVGIGNSNSTLAVDTFHHIAVVYDNSANTLTYYADGSSDGTKMSVSALSDVTASLNIGRRSYVGSEGYFNGTIDEVAIYNRSLSADEILEHYQRGALRLNISVHDCNDASCSGEESTWDATCENATYCDISSVSNARYFQYKATFTTDLSNYTPALNNVSIYYTANSSVFTNSTGNYVYNLDTTSYNIGNHTIHVNATYSNPYYAERDENLEILSNAPPVLTAINYTPSSPNTSDNIIFNSTLTDPNAADSGSLIVYCEIYNNSVYFATDTFSSLANGTVVNCTVTSANTTKGQNWSVNMTAYDGTVNSTLVASAQVTIGNAAPTHDAPILNTSSGTNVTTANLTCYPQNVADADSDSVTNITTWFKNDKPLAVLQMPFDHNNSNSTGTTKDYSGYNNHGAVVGATFNRTGGLNGSGAYMFDGSNDYIQIPNVDNQNISNNITIEAWIKLNSTTNSFIVGKDQAYRLWFNDYGDEVWNNLIFEIYNGTDWEQFSATLSWQKNIWYHVAGVYNGTHLVGYRDGASVGTPKAYSGDIVVYGNNIIIGKYEWDNNYDFNGSIDEVRIYNYSLSAEQILAHYNKEYWKIVSNETTKGENYTCQVIPDDSYDEGTAKNSSTLILANSLPPKVILLSPTEGNTTIHARRPVFKWQNSTDPDGDAVTYNISITNSVAPDVSNTSYEGLNFTHNEDLWTNTETSGNLYYWKVAACDPTQCGSWSDTWNFSIEPYISLSMINDSVDFGNKNTGDKDNTTDGSPGPFVVQNDGNVIANITWVSANQSLWTNAGLNTEYFRFKVDNTTNEPGSFNYSASTITWTNITDIGVKNETAVAYLHYNDSKDTAEIDLLIEVPGVEPPGMKLVTVYVIGQDAS